MPLRYLANVAYLQVRLADAVAYQRAAVERARQRPPAPQSGRLGGGAGDADARWLTDPSPVVGSPHGEDGRPRGRARLAPRRGALR
ncbi:MAG: hypothetical protein U0802_01245 [Candidatus Binatia bacterium]